MINILLLLIIIIIIMLWTQGIHTDREVTANRTHKTIKKREKPCTLIDVAIPANRSAT